MNTQVTVTTSLKRMINWLNRNPFFSLIILCLFIFSITSFKTTETIAPTKVGVVDLEFVVAMSKQGLELQQQLENFQRSVQLEAERMNAEAVDIRNKIAEGANSLSQDQLFQLQKDFEDKGIEINRFRDDKQREGQKIQAEGLRQIELAMEPKAKLLIEREGVEILLNHVAGVVVMATENVDLSKKLVDLMNE